MDDFNAKVKNRFVLVMGRDDLRYIESSDVNNSNGDLLKSIYFDRNLVLVNNLIFSDKTFSDSLTFRRKEQWISQLDYCIVSQERLDAIQRFDVIQDLTLPSDHAIISVGMSINQSYVIKKDLRQSVQSLMDYTETRNTTNIVKKVIPIDRIDIQELRKNASNISVPESPLNLYEFYTYCNKIYSALYELSSRSLARNTKAWDTSLSRWTRLLNSKDSSSIWKVINWKGELQDQPECEPTEEKFKQHFEALLNPSDRVSINTADFIVSPYITILDDDVSYNEVNDFIDQCKPNKACDMNGLSPGIFKFLPAQWILTIVSLCNIVLNTFFQPPSWIYSKLIGIFKKGDRKLGGNFRGISVNDTIYRIFEKVLYNRLVAWYRPSKEQAGCQEKRGCLEQILTARLLCDYAKKKRVKLYLL